MPIVDVEIVLMPGESPAADLAARLADEIGDIMESPPGGTWVKLRLVPWERYAENGGAPENVFPVLVNILKSKFPHPGQFEAEVERVTEAVARLCARPSANVHLVYLPEGRGRVAFGGKIVR